MAIQPDIALQAAPEVQFDPIGSASKGITLKNLMTEAEFKRPKLEAELASSRAGTEQTQAATEAARIQNEQAQRQLATRKTMSDLLKKHTKIDPKTGKVSSDFGAAADEAATLGVDIGTLHEYITKDADNAKKRIDNTKDATEFADKSIDRAMNLIRTASPEQVPGILQSAKLAVEKAAGHVMSQDEVQKYVTNAFGLPAEGPPIDPATGQPDLAGTVKMLKDRANTYAASTISPQQAIANAQTEEQLRQGRVSLGLTGETVTQAGAGAGTGPEGRDPMSALSKATREQLAAAGYPVPQTLSHVNAMNNPVYKAILQGAAPGADVKGRALDEAHALEAKARMTDRWLSAANKITHVNLTPLAILKGAYDKKLENDPAFQEYAAMVKEMNAAGIQLPEVAPKAVASVAKRLGDDFRKQSEDAKKVVKAPTFREAAGEEAPSGETAVGAVKQGKGGVSYRKVKKGPDTDRTTWQKE